MSETYTGVRVIEVKQELIAQLYQARYIPITFDKRYSFSQNEFVVLKDITEGPTKCESVVTRCVGDRLIQVKERYKLKASNVEPRNKEQHMALDALLDDRIKVVVLTGKAGTGKSQPLDAKILTPSGWTTMGSIKPGTEIFSPNGSVATVQSIHPQGVLDIYRVTFSDGSSTECSLEHLWYTYSQKDRDNHREGSVKTLAEIKETLRYGKSRKRNHSIPMVNNISFEIENDLKLHPYLLGLLLGDGSMSVGAVMFSTADEQLVHKVDDIVALYNMRTTHASGYDYRIIHNHKPKWNEGNYIKNILQTYGLWGCNSANKFIPEEYKLTSHNTRLKVLQGLLDSDGTIDKRTGNISFSSTSIHLAEDVRYLVMSLGGKAKVKEKQTSFTYNGIKKLGKLSYVVAISLPNNIQPFQLDRKQAYVKVKTKYPPRRYIDSVEHVGCKETQCIYLDSKDHLYVTDDFIVTHNTLLTLASALQKMDDREYDKIILTRPMSWVGKHGLGALPGDENDKFKPYLQNYMCNIEHLLNGQRNSVDHLIHHYRMDFQPIQLIRGASWSGAFIIADEVQVLDYDEMVTLGTRVGEDSKLVIMGDLGQRDEKIAKERTGIYKFVNDHRAKQSPLVASIELQKCVRSEVAALFASIFEK